MSPSSKQLRRRPFFLRNQPQRDQTQSSSDATKLEHIDISVGSLGHDSKARNQPGWFPTHCPPPPHAGREWIKHCLSDKPSPRQVFRNSDLSVPALISLFICIGLGLIGIFIWASCLRHTYRYINKHRFYSPDQHLTGNVGNLSFRFKRLSKHRPRKGIVQGWIDVDKTNEGFDSIIEQKKKSLWASHDEGFDNENEYINLGDYPDNDFDYEGQYGKPAEQVYFDGLIGSIKGGGLIRRALGKATLKTKSLQESIWGKALQGLGPDQPHNTFKSKEGKGFLVEKYQFAGDKQGGQLVHSTRSASGVSIVCESGEMSLSFRRDALIRQAVKKEQKKNLNLGRGTLYSQPQSHCSVTDISIEKDEKDEKDVAVVDCSMATSNDTE